MMDIGGILCVLDETDNALRTGLIIFLLFWVALTLITAKHLFFKPPKSNEQIVQKRIVKKDLSSNPSYLERGNTVHRTDGKVIKDDEIPYLMQMGYKEALRKNGLNTQNPLDVSSITAMDKNKPIYTKIPSYEELCNIKNEDYLLLSTDLLFAKYIDGLPLINPSIAQYWFYEYNLNYSAEIKKLFSCQIVCLTKSNINGLKVNDLKNLLKHFNLPVSGKKEELKERIISSVNDNDIAAYLGTDNYIFTLTSKGKSKVEKIFDSATKNIELEDLCISLIMHEQFEDAYLKIVSFKNSTPEGSVSYAYNSSQNQLYMDMMFSNAFNYTLSKNHDLELEIRAAVIFCRM